MNDTTADPSEPEATEPNSPTIDAEPPAAAPDDAQPAEDTNEARKYRRRAQAAEKERDNLAATVETLQRQIIDGITEQDHLNPAALWATTQLADLLGDDGSVDTTKVDTAIRQARERLGIPHGLYVPAEGRQPTTHSHTPTFSDAFSPRDRRKT